MLIKEFNFHLPPELIAQFPAKRREMSKLLVLNRKDGTITHTKFYNIVNYLHPEDLLVLNQTKVFPARLRGKRIPTGGKVEVLLVKQLGSPSIWEVLLTPLRARKVGVEIEFGSNFYAKVIKVNKRVTLQFYHEAEFWSLLNKYGEIPLPPYIKRKPTQLDKERYQTVYATSVGSIAAPTAGLHFTKKILTQLKTKGVKIEKITLHVGVGTFSPIRTQQIEDHKMEEEYYEIPPSLPKIIHSSSRVVAVGTTVVRTLETAFEKENPLLQGWTTKFIYPPYQFKVVDALITNFHLPSSTVLLLVCAFAGKELILNTYKEAIQKRYKFYSYGDCMFIV
jgi:S-adenosylmethionine:tRNA ribosyltransferase-isomerase